MRVERISRVLQSCHMVKVFSLMEWCPKNIGSKTDSYEIICPPMKVCGMPCTVVSIRWAKPELGC